MCTNHILYNITINKSALHFNRDQYTGCVKTEGAKEDRTCKLIIRNKKIKIDQDKSYKVLGTVEEGIFNTKLYIFSIEEVEHPYDKISLDEIF